MRKGFVVESWVCFEHSTQIPRCFTLTPRFFVSEFWVCCRVMGFFRTFHTHTHTPWCFTPTQIFSVSEFWLCCRVLGMFRTFHPHTHIHTTMLYAYPTICFKFWVCCWVLDLFRTFHTHTRWCFTPNPRFFFPSFGFVVEFSVCFEHFSNTPWCFTPIPRFFYFRVLGLNLFNFNCRIV